MPYQTSRRTGGDGRLTSALDPHDQGPQDACGVFGVWAPGEDVAKLTYFGLYALQHRGQESAGIAVSNGRQILVYKDMGLVSQVFDESTLDSLKGHLAIGHSRYSTTGASTWQNAQPTFRPTGDGSIALGHNGNLINTHELRGMVGELPGPAGELDIKGVEGATNDTSLVTALLAHHPDSSLEQRALEVGLALATRPKLLLLDEPMAGMGPEESARMIELIGRVRAAVTVLLVEHDMDAVFRLADRITVLVSGRVIASGAPEAIRADAEVRRAYLGDEVAA